MGKPIDKVGEARAKLGLPPLEILIDSEEIGPSAEDKREKLIRNWDTGDYLFGFFQFVGLFCALGPLIGTIITGMRYNVLSHPGFFFIVFGAYFIGLIPFMLTGICSAVAAYMLKKWLPALQSRTTISFVAGFIAASFWWFLLQFIRVDPVQAVTMSNGPPGPSFGNTSLMAAVFAGVICGAIGYGYIFPKTRPNSSLDSGVPVERRST